MHLWNQQFWVGLDFFFFIKLSYLCVEGWTVGTVYVVFHMFSSSDVDFFWVLCFLPTLQDWLATLNSSRVFSHHLLGVPGIGSGSTTTLTKIKMNEYTVCLDSTQWLTAADASISLAPFSCVEAPAQNLSD